MALTNSFPTGLSTGLTLPDTRRNIAALITRDTTGAPRLGILPRHFLPLVTGTASMAYAVGSFEAVVSRTGVGVELVVNDGTTNVPTTAAPPANSRIDVVWVRTRFTASDNSDTPEFGVEKGVASSSPVKPTIPAGALEIATASVPSSAIATNNQGVVITQTHLYTATAGGQIVVRNLAERDAFKAMLGQSVYVIANGADYTRDGAGWALAREDTGRISVTSFMNGYSMATPVSYRRINGVVHLAGSLYNATAPNTGAAFILPEGFRPPSTVLMCTVPGWGAYAQVEPNGQVSYTALVPRTNSTGFSLNAISYPAFS